MWITHACYILVFVLHHCCNRQTIICGPFTFLANQHNMCLLYQCICRNINSCTIAMTIPILHASIVGMLKETKINVREYRMGNQKWTIQRNLQHRVHKTKENKTKTQRNTICVGHHYAQTNTTNDFLGMWELWLIRFCYQPAICNLWSINRLQRVT